MIEQVPDFRGRFSDDATLAAKLRTEKERKKRETDREAIASDVEAFLARGGVIQVAETGNSGQRIEIELDDQGQPRYKNANNFSEMAISEKGKRHQGEKIRGSRTRKKK